MNAPVDHHAPRAANAIATPTGLSVLCEPDEPSIDIVFVHGFTGHPELTWTHKSGAARRVTEGHDVGDSSEPPSKMRKLNPFSKTHPGHGETSASVCWPRDLLPTTFPSARVLTYGYDTHIRHRLGPVLNSTTVYDIAGDFLVALEAQRRSEPSRPLLFVAHSLGGIVVKEMLRRAKNCQSRQPHLHQICGATVGIMFFGTPHGGADPRGLLLSVAKTLIKAAGFYVNEQIVNALLPSSERLRELRDEFGPIANEENWVIHSFQEGLGMQYLGGDKVVEDISSYLNLSPIETTEHIGRDHRDMCRFTGPNDGEYKKVAAALERMVTLPAPTKPRDSIVVPEALNDDQKRRLMDFLKFDQMDSRQMSVKAAHLKTCKWLLKRPEYLDWVDKSKSGQHHGFLWMKGKAGAGKSTLMKFALKLARSRMKDKVIISFFFNARGDDLERSTLGMYRSLLLQLLERLPRLQKVFEALGFASWNSMGGYNWSIESLKDLFEQSILLLEESPIVCFIDALDECDEIQIRDMVTFLQHLGELAVSKGIQFQVLLSSRHYPYITIAKGLELVLEGQEGHTQDIINYVDSELRIGRTKLAEQIRGELQEKASGVFMWVVLVVDILNKEHDEGRTARRLHQKLKEIPGDLHELFRDLLTRDCRNKEELLLCIQWVLFARHPLKPEQLYFGILSGTEPEDLSAWDQDETSMETISRFILNSSKGLVEITTSKVPTAQFIHESVRDFLLKERGLKKIWSDVGNDFQPQSHQRLSTCCIEYMKSGLEACRVIAPKIIAAESGPERQSLRVSMGAEYPLLEYAVQNVLHHAEAAEEGGVSQEAFLQMFPLTDWMTIHNVFEKFKTRWHLPPEPSLLYILAEHNLPSLIRAYSPSTSSFELQLGHRGRYGPPFFAALATKSEGAVKALLDLELRLVMGVGTLPSSLRSLCDRYRENPQRRKELGREFSFSFQSTALSSALKLEDLMLASIIFMCGHHGPVVHETHVERFKGLILLATSNQDPEGLMLLLEAYDNFNSEFNSDDALLLKQTLLSPALEAAAANGIDSMVPVLLSDGANSNALASKSQTALGYAIRGHRLSTVELLLSHGADVNHLGADGRTPLGWAIDDENLPMTNLLLERGADTELRDGTGQTPFCRAVERMNMEVVTLSLKHYAAEAHARNYLGFNPLSTPSILPISELGMMAICTALLDHGADINAKGLAGRTPLVQAVVLGPDTAPTVEFLLSRGADPNAMDPDGWTPLLWVVRLWGGRYRRIYPIVWSLLRSGADPNQADGRRETPLHVAVMKGYNDVVRLFLQNGADVGLKNEDGLTPFDMARNLDADVMELLRIPGTVSGG
ncbi:hypothetical protein B0T19DRAFT_413885 [Cercophora scortea]|uniref:Nephrocystin 3-like N-terminal domain-containing protein n=1 Tax=Cercophora scortea TaxID=314031 RepID=A0AAE0IUZ1_9PEZI|nr:hypothetical protein B0T19DRAFT_413885 [Cercophora scortea]